MLCRSRVTLFSLSNKSTWYDRREGRPSVPKSLGYRCRLLRPDCGTVASGLIDLIRKVVDLESQGMLSIFNGIDIDQGHENIKVSYQS
jgi:hypothetical protein